MTFPNGSVVSVSDGEGFVSRDLQVLYDAVTSNSLRILADMQDYPVHSSPLRVGDDDQVRPVVVTPYEYGPFELTSVQDRFLHETRHQDFVSGMTTQRWKPNTTITALFYDMSYLDGETGEFVQSDDKTKITAPGFIDNAITALNEVVSMIPEDQNISLDIKIESEDQDFLFPREYDLTDDNPYMYHAGEPQALFFLTQSTATNGAYIRNATLSHRSGFEGSYIFDVSSAVRSDVIENFGVRTTGHEADILDENTLVSFVVEYVYLPDHSGRIELNE